MAEKFEIKEDGTIIFPERKVEAETEEDRLRAEFIALEHEVVHSIAHHTEDPVKIARYHELKKIFGVEKETDVFQVGQELLKKSDTEETKDVNAEFWARVKKLGTEHK